jgi:hypothetical protein
MCTTCKLTIPCCCTSSFKIILFVQSCIFLSVGIFGMYTIQHNEQTKTITDSQYKIWLGLIISMISLSSIGILFSVIRCNKKNYDYFDLEENNTLQYGSSLYDSIQVNKQTQFPNRTVI